MTVRAFSYPRNLDEALAQLAVLTRDVQDLREWFFRYHVSSTQGAALAGQGSVEPEAPQPLSISPWHWDVTCLGHFEVRCAGKVVPACPSRRGQAILAYLLASAHHVALRDVLMETFWPDAAPESGAHNMQMAISALRHTLRGCGPNAGDDAILFDADHYFLNPALLIELDVDGFRDAANRGLRAAAVGMDTAVGLCEEARRRYTGAYFAHCPYDGWVEQQRGTLQDLYLRVLDRLSTLYGREGDWDGAAGCCHDILALDPFQEDAYQQLMRCYAAKDYPAGIQRAYRQCREVLWRDLCVTPAEETERLYQSLMKARLLRSAEMEEDWSARLTY